MGAKYQWYCWAHFCTHRPEHPCAWAKISSNCHPQEWSATAQAMQILQLPTYRQWFSQAVVPVCTCISSMCGFANSSSLLLCQFWPLHCRKGKESEVAPSCPTLCYPMDCSLQGSSVHGIFQAKVLEWVAISFSRGGLPTQGMNSGLPHCRQMLYSLSHQGSTVESFALILKVWIRCLCAPLAPVLTSWPQESDPRAYAWQMWKDAAQIPSCWPPGAPPPLVLRPHVPQTAPSQGLSTVGYHSRLSSITPRTPLMDDAGSRTSRWAGTSFLGVALQHNALCPHLLSPALHRCPVMQSESSPTFSGSLLHRSVLDRHFLQEISYVNMFLLSSEGRRKLLGPTWIPLLFPWV